MTPQRFEAKNIAPLDRVWSRQGAMESRLPPSKQTTYEWTENSFLVVFPEKNKPAGERASLVVVVVCLGTAVYTYPSNNKPTRNRPQNQSLATGFCPNAPATTIQQHYPGPLTRKKKKRRRNPASSNTAIFLIIIHKPDNVSDNGRGNDWSVRFLATSYVHTASTGFR